MTPDAPELGNAPIMVRLKQETAEYHTRLETLPFFNALIDHALPLECYLGQLRAMSVVHAILEHELAAARNDPVRMVWEADLRKLGLLQNDILFFKPRIQPETVASVEAALQMAQRIRQRALESPATLLGYLYVLEGSTLGNHMHGKDVAATFQLDSAAGRRYYSSYQDTVHDHWKAFSTRMNDALTDLNVQTAVLEAAHEAFQGLEVVYAALYPLTQRASRIHTTQINPEAGNHPMPSDEAEINAALQASEKSWRAFPYYEMRYGERGRRFSDSDICWLVTLAHLEPDDMFKQVDWLSRVLATRGMPRIMLEETLFRLHDRLVAAVPEKAAIYANLLGAGERLRQARCAILPQAVLEQLVQAFESAVGQSMSQQHPRFAELLVAAVADESSGITGTRTAIEQWLTDADRFPQAWIDALQKTASEAEQAAKGGVHAE